MHLRELGVDLEQEDDAAVLLGLTLEKESNTGLLDMKQTGLIQHTIAVVRLDGGMVIQSRGL